jgi:hypothetical protein
MFLRTTILALLLLPVLSSVTLAAGRHHSSRKHHRPAPAALPESNVVCGLSPAPVQRRAFVLDGRLYEDLSYLDSNGQLNVWIEDLGTTSPADFEVTPLFVTLADFGFGGGSARHVASDLGTRRSTTSHATSTAPPAVPAPGPPTPGHWVDQYGREISTEE